MESYFDIYKKENCTGCGVCSLKCPQNAIQMVCDEEGFLYPEIDKKKCIKCGLCKKVCGNITDINLFDMKCYAVKNKDNEQRKASTSGGVFKVLAQYVISKKGVVFGAVYSEKLEVFHCSAKNMKDAAKFSLSKYVRSDMKNCYKEIEKFLEANILVLFSGTPCQCYGLKKYLNKNFSNLILCEIMCHSNPSPLVLKMFLKNIECNENKKIKKYFFRNKTELFNGLPYCVFEDGTKKGYNDYNVAFNKMLISRPSCSNCNFCTLNRKADITIGDFWGIEKIEKNFNDGLGVSMFTINSKKGEQVFREIKDYFIFCETDKENTFKYNHNSNQKMNKNRKKFFQMIANNKINSNNIIIYLKKYSQDNIFTKAILKIKRIIKKIIKAINKH